MNSAIINYDPASIDYKISYSTDHLIFKYKAHCGISYQCCNTFYECNIESILRYSAGVYD